MYRFGKLCYHGHWFSGSMENLQGDIDLYNQEINGTVDVALYKGNVMVLGREPN